MKTPRAHPQPPKAFDWSLVRSFLAALDHGTLSGAARALQVGQPTLGRHVAELESQWGVVLFERTGRGLAPTPVALALAAAARDMEAGALQLSGVLSGAHTALGGTVRITASEPVAHYLLPPALAALRLAHPEITLELVASNQVSNLLRREADIALRMVRPDQSSLVARKLGEVGLGAYAHPSYLARRGAPQTAADLLQHELVGGDTDSTILEGFGALGVPIAREAFVFRSDDLVLQWQAVRAGLGIGFFAHYLARTDPVVQRVLPDALPIPPLPMWLVVHREIRSSPRIRLVFDFLARTLPATISP